MTLPILPFYSPNWLAIGYYFLALCEDLEFDSESAAQDGLDLAGWLEGVEPVPKQFARMTEKFEYAFGEVEVFSDMVSDLACLQMLALIRRIVDCGMTAATMRDSLGGIETLLPSTLSADKLDRVAQAVRELLMPMVKQGVDEVTSVDYTEEWTSRVHASNVCMLNILDAMQQRSDMLRSSDGTPAST